MGKSPRGRAAAEAGFLCCSSRGVAAVPLWLTWLLVVRPQRLKAALSQQSPSGTPGGLMAMGSSPMVPQKAEQSQLLVQQPDAPSPAQPQVHTRPDCSSAPAPPAPDTSLERQSHTSKPGFNSHFSPATVRETRAELLVER